MKESKVSLKARKELLIKVRDKYKNAGWKEKVEILNGFIASTGYQRKHAIMLLNSESSTKAIRANKRKKQPIYDDAVQKMLITAWQAANEICAKRFVPFLPELVAALERHGHICLTPEVRKKLLNISAATADRILSIERHKHCKGMTTTKPGNLLKKQIKIHTFWGWDDIIPFPILNWSYN